MLKKRKTLTRADAVSVQKVLEFVAAGAVNAQKVLAWPVRRHVYSQGRWRSSFHPPSLVTAGLALFDIGGPQ